MYCGNCGKQIDDGALFCGECGASILPNEAETSAVNNGNELRTNKSEQELYKKKGKGNVLIYITIALVCVCLVATGTIVFLLLNGRGSETISENDQQMVSPSDGNVSILGGTSQDNSNGTVILTVGNYPTETVVNPLILTGTMLSKENTAFLTIDGQRVNSVSSVDGIISWEEEVQLVQGINTITISLVDNAGNADTETITINYTEAWPFPYGTELTRTSGEANYMIYVRPGPSKESGEPILKIMPGDFTTTLIYLGEYQQEISSTDGIHNWYKVELPDGREGWIRDDLTARK